MFASRDFSPTESRSNLKTLRSGDREHSMSELCFEFVEHGFTEPRGYVSDDASDRTTDGVVCFLSTDDALCR